MKLCTIPKAASVVGVPEFRLRRMQKEGKLPGFFAGNRYYVDTDAVLAQLAAECAANAQQISESVRP